MFFIVEEFDMSIYAIAVFVDNDNPIGARLINTDNNKMMDCRNSDIVGLHNTGYKFENLDIVNDQIKWTNGVWKRYPQIYRDGHIDNANSAVIIGVTSTKSYKMINKDGKTVIVDEAKTIAYGNKFGFANCKLSHKTNNDGSKTWVIQSISGNIPEIDSKLHMSLKSENCLEIILPNDNSVSELRIPNLINGLRSKTLDIILVQPVSAAKFIKKITFEDSYWYLCYNMVDKFINLETVIMNSARIFIDEGTFNNNPKLREFYTKGTNRIGTRAFENCTELKKYYSESIVNEVSPRAFRNCHSFDIQGFINRGVRNLTSSNIFEGCKIEEVVIPSTTVEISGNTFNGCKNLHKIVVDSGITSIESKSKFKIICDIYLRDSGCSLQGSTSDYDDNYGFPENVTVHVTNYSKDKPNIAKSITKAKLAGLDLKNNELIVSSYKDAMVVFKTRSQKEIRNFIVSCINDYINGVIGWRTSKRKLGDYTVNYNISTTCKIHKAKDCGEKEDAIYYSTSNKIYIIPTNKELFLDIIQYRLMVYQRYTSGITIFAYTIENNGKIDHIIYNKEQRIIVVTFRNKSKRLIKLDERVY